MLEQEMKGKLEQAASVGNQKAEEYLNIEKQIDDYNNSLVDLNKAHFDDNKEIVVNEDEMSPVQIEEFWNYNNVWLKTQNEMMQEFPPTVEGATKEEITSSLNRINDNTNEYIKTVDEKIDIAKEKPEQSFGLGKLVFSSIGKINTGLKNIRKSLSKEELFSETGKLTSIFNKAVDAFNKHTRDANDKDKILTNGIKTLEKELKTLQNDLDENIPKTKKQIENTIKELEIKKKATLANQISGALSEEEFYKQISELDSKIKN